MAGSSLPGQRLAMMVAMDCCRVRVDELAAELKSDAAEALAAVLQRKAAAQVRRF
jgi:hypothetical protein